jgi:hypothetical protein
MNLASAAVGGDAGATELQARRISLLARRRRSPYLRKSAFIRGSSFSVVSVSLADVAEGGGGA